MNSGYGGFKYGTAKLETLLSPWESRFLLSFLGQVTSFPRHAGLTVTAVGLGFRFGFVHYSHNDGVFS